MKRFLLSCWALYFCSLSLSFGAGFAELSGEWRYESLVIPSYVLNGVPSTEFETVSIDATFSDDATFGFTEFARQGGQNETGSGILFFFGSDLRTLGIFGGDLEDIETEDSLHGNVSIAKDAMSVVEFSDQMSPSDNYNLGIIVRAPSSLGIADLQGSWLAHFVEFPSDINGGNFSTPFDSETTPVEFDAGGNATVAGESIGSLTVPDNRHFVFDDGEQQSFYVNQAKDVAIGNSSESDEVVFDVLVKKPGALAVSELAGDWRIMVIAAPNVTSFAPPNDNFDDFDGFTGTLIVDAAGDVTGDSTGSLTVNPDNTVTFTDEDSNATILSINESKNFIITMFQTDEFVDVTVLIKIQSAAPARTDGIIDIAKTAQLTVEFDAELSPTLELLQSKDLRNWLLYPLGDGERVIPMFTNGGNALFYQTIENE